MKLLKRKNIIRILIAIFTIYALCLIYKARVAYLESGPITDSIYSEYKSLLDSEKMKASYEVETRTSKVRKPFSVIKYDNKYFLTIYKIDLLNDASIDTVLKVEKRRTFITKFIAYNTILEKPYTFRYKIGNISKPAKIYFSVSGDSIKETLFNENLYQLTGNINVFSIRNGSEKSIDIMGESNSFLSLKKIESSFMFIKKDKAVYILFLFPTDIDGKLEPNLLYQLTNRK